MTQPEFDCAARKLAYTQATVLLGKGPLSAGLRDVHDALQLSNCNATHTEPTHTEPTHTDNRAVKTTLATLHVATTGSDATGDGSVGSPFLSLRAARDAARAKNDGPGGQVVGTIAVAAGRYQLNETLSLGPADNGMTFQGEKGTVISGGLALELQLSPAAGTDLLNWPTGTMMAQLPPGTGRLRSLYDDHHSGSDPRLGARLPWAREPNGQVESDLQPLHLAKARGEGSTPSGPSENGSMYSIVETPRRNNSVYPIWGRDYDPRDRRGGEIVGWQWHHVGGTSRRFGDDVPTVCFHIIRNLETMHD